MDSEEKKDLKVNFSSLFFEESKWVSFLLHCWINDFIHKLFSGLKISKESDNSLDIKRCIKIIGETGYCCLCIATKEMREKQTNKWYVRNIVTDILLGSPRSFWDLSVHHPQILFLAHPVCTESMIPLPRSYIVHSILIIATSLRQITAKKSINTP